MSLDKDKYLTPAPNLHRTRASHDLQYTRYFAYSDALKNSFFPRTIPLWNSLPSSVVSSKTTEEFKGVNTNRWDPILNYPGCMEVVLLLRLYLNEYLSDFHVFFCIRF